MGTPEFAVPAMEKLHSEYGVAAAVTVPDKPKGRGLKLMPSPVKIAAGNYGIPVLQPESLKEPGFISQIEEISPDIIAVIAFRILPAAVYSKAKVASFNVHGSLLPKYRGAAPINWAIINGEKISGLTTFLLQEKVDTGFILLKKELAIPENATAGDLHDLLMPEAAILAAETVELLLSGNYSPIVQDESAACPAPKLYRENCRISWDLPVENIKNFIQGTSPVPGAWTKFEDKTLKILRCELDNIKLDFPGDFKIIEGKFYVQCLDGAISLKQIQPEGKNQMWVQDFLRGWRGATEGKLNA